MANGSWWTVPRDGSSVQPWTYLCQACIASSVLSCGRYIHSGHTVVLSRAVIYNNHHLCNHKDDIFYVFLLVFSATSLIHHSPVTLIFDVRFLSCVVERQLTQLARSLVLCWRSCCTGRPAALFGCDKNRCRLPQFIDLLQLHAALFFKWPAVLSFSTFLYLRDYRLCNNSTLHTRSGFLVLYWVILQQYE